MWLPGLIAVVFSCFLLGYFILGDGYVPLLQKLLYSNVFPSVISMTGARPYNSKKKETDEGDG